MGSKASDAQRQGVQRLGFRPDPAWAVDSPSFGFRQGRVTTAQWEAPDLARATNLVAFPSPAGEGQGAHT